MLSGARSGPLRHLQPRTQASPTVSIFRAISEDPFFSIAVYADNLVPALIRAGVDVREIAFSRRHPVWLATRLTPAFNRYVLYPLQAARSQGDVNHILDHAYGHLAFVLDARRTVISCNSMSVPKALRGEIPEFRISPRLKATIWLRHRGMLRCGRIVACSYALKQTIVDFFECDPSLVEVVYDGVNHAVFQPVADRQRLDRIRRTCGLPDDHTRLVMVVCTDSEAGYKNRLATLRTHYALRQRGERVMLVLVGAPLNQGELAFIDRHELTTSVRNVGRVPLDVLVGLYNLADVLLFPSWDEGFGYPPLEAMACGTPVVASNIPVLKETLGDAALTGAPDDPNDLADKVQLILDSAALADRLRNTGIQQARQYSWDRYAREISRVYADVACS